MKRKNPKRREAEKISDFPARAVSPSIENKKSSAFIIEKKNDEEGNLRGWAFVFREEVLCEDLLEEGPGRLGRGVGCPKAKSRSGVLRT